jgi:hypothetical protein
MPCQGINSGIQFNRLGKILWLSLTLAVAGKMVCKIVSLKYRLLENRKACLCRAAG